MSLVIIGSIALDDIETPFGKVEKIVGGATPFASLAASYFYEKVKVIGIIGGDFPKSELEIWKEHKIDLEGLQIAEDRKNFYWSGKYHNDMNNRDTLETGLNVLEDFDPIYPDSYQDCEYLLLANLSPVTQLLAINRLKNRPKLIVMDTMNFWMDIAMDDLLATIKMVDVLTINDAEARQLSGEYSLVKAANRILAMGPKYLIIKKGEHGALLFHQDQIFSAPALPLAEVFDPTGAGDTFAGGFIGYMAHVGTVNFNNMKNAIIYGSALASFCVEKFGTEKIKNLSESEVAARVQEFVKLSDFKIEN
ncbi:MAG: sugar kinase [Bacteroidetes bacterium]|nr:sugar kinase [Bacteroidota bacterium]MBU1484782.1 sugar kinase [Bacteroidota bacterium]MBU1760479.1 sugar kinase [Bacteroidota bacterium]MBU2046945.1 sugar kinase [Bacteroidota bacterium]MBU2268388.1 sugar kinase [Bacteroidota bacterium]